MAGRHLQQCLTVAAQTVHDLPFVRNHAGEWDRQVACPVIAHLRLGVESGGFAAASVEPVLHIRFGGEKIRARLHLAGEVDQARQADDVRFAERNHAVGAGERGEGRGVTARCRAVKGQFLINLDGGGNIADDQVVAVLEPFEHLGEGAGAHLGPT